MVLYLLLRHSSIQLRQFSIWKLQNPIFHKKFGPAKKSLQMSARIGWIGDKFLNLEGSDHRNRLFYAGHWIHTLLLIVSSVGRTEIGLHDFLQDNLQAFVAAVL